jgi:septum formation protein
MKKKIKMILASASPRRKQMLEDAGYEFVVAASGIEEHDPEFGDPHEVAKKNALLKAENVANKIDSGIIVGSDTVVALGKRLIGKPKDRVDAVNILKTLSKSKHSVVSAVALVDAKTGMCAAFTDETFVTMRPMTDAEIADYVDSGEADGKAGAYAIQETGDKFVIKIDGLVSTVAGFPIELFKKFLDDFLKDAK